MPPPIQADEIDPERATYVWRDRIPRKMITIIAGRPDQGKGTCVAGIAADVSRTMFQFEDGSSRRGRVLYSAIEDSHTIMTQPRLQAAGAVLAQIGLWRFRLPLMMKELEYHLTHDRYGDENPADLLVIDPLASHLTDGISRHSDNIRKVTDPLTELVEKTGTAVIVVEHVLKRVPASSHPLGAIGGSSSGIVAAARMAFLFGADPDNGDRRLLCNVKANICEKPMEIEFEMDTVDVNPVGDQPFLVYQGETNYDPMVFLTIKKDGTIGRPPDKRAAACEWLTDYLYNAGKPVPAGTVFEDALQWGMTQKTLRRASTDMGVLRDPPGGGRACTWALPPDLLKRLNSANSGAESMLSEDDFNNLLGDK